MSVGSSTSACRIKRRARTTLRPASLSPRPRYSGQLARKFETADAYAGTHENPAAKVSFAKRQRDVGKKSSPGKDRKKRRRLDERFPVPSRFSETASRTRRERRNTRPLTWHTKRRQAEHLAAFRETEERRCRESRLATRCCSRKVKKKALSSTSARAICARRHTARHARPAETHESTRPRAHVRPASRQRLAQAGPRPAGELRETRSSDEPTRACGYFFEP